jgi:DNA processing protein
MSNYSEATYWLTLINESGLKLSLVKPIIQRWCVAEKRKLADLFELSPLELSTTFGLPDETTAQVIDSSQQLAAQAAALSRWQAEGLEPLIRIDPRYPKRLAYTLPPAKQPLVLWTRGPVDLLNRPGVTMLGRTDSEEATSRFIDELMVTLEAEEIGLVSGYGRGLDRMTCEAMLATENGYAVAVLPMGLSAFAKTTGKLESVVESGQAVLVSPFAPDTPFQEKLAEARNLLIDHLTLALLIPESDEHAQARAMIALERGLPVFVKADTTGNRALLEQGALLLTDSGEVVEWVQQAMVDLAVQEAEDEPPPEDLTAAPLAATAPTDPPTSDEDYSLRSEEAPPLDSEEALEVLSLGGEIPEILRRRLQKPK